MAQRCVTCSLTMNSPAQFEQHLMGKAHAKRLKKIAETGEAPAPFKQINFIAAGQSAQGRSASGAAAAAVATPEAQPQPQSGMSNLDLFCDLCMIKLNSAEQARIHYSGTKHQKKLRGTRNHFKAEAQAQAQAQPEASSTPQAENGVTHGTLFCGFCKISVNSPSQMDFHREGSHHRKMVEGMKRQMEGDSNPNQGAPPAKRPTPPTTTTVPFNPTTGTYTYSPFPPPPPPTTMGAGNAAASYMNYDMSGTITQQQVM